jgi:Fe-S-cluster containining protein
MSLTLEDVQRLETAGERGFYRAADDGSLRLATVGDRCVFLTEGRCRVYANRPEGCVLYPLVWNVISNEPDLHEFCPYAQQFRFSAGDREWLARSIETEEREIAARLEAGVDERTAR